MRAFVQVAAVGSFTGAAADLGVTTATVSQCVTALEKHVGYELLERTTRSVQLTHTGRFLLPTFQRILYLLIATVGR